MLCHKTPPAAPHGKKICNAVGKTVFARCYAGKDKTVLACGNVLKRLRTEYSCQLKSIKNFYR
jgi:hypothetical protein